MANQILILIYQFFLPVECPEYSQLNQCISRCPITCLNYENPPECLPVCQVGCECLPGFIKINKNPQSLCVKQYECSLYAKNKRSHNSQNDEYLFNKKPNETLTNEYSNGTTEPSFNEQTL